MIVWILSSILCFYLFRKFTSKIEIRERGEWKKFAMPLWLWLVAGFLSVVPILNYIILIIFICGVLNDISDKYADTRVQEGKSLWLKKFLDFMNKEF